MTSSGKGLTHNFKGIDKTLKITILVLYLSRKISACTMYIFLKQIPFQNLRERLLFFKIFRDFLKNFFDIYCIYFFHFRC